MSAGLLRRHVRSQVLEALGESRAVALLGARQVGKSTLVRELRAFKADPSRLRERMHAEGAAERDGYCHYIETAAGSQS